MSSDSPPPLPPLPSSPPSSSIHPPSSPSHLPPVDSSSSSSPAVPIDEEELRLNPDNLYDINAPPPLPVPSSSLSLPTDTIDIDLVGQLRSAWLNERLCPELLFYEDEIVEMAKREIEKQERRVGKMSQQRGNSSGNNPMSTYNSTTVTQSDDIIPHLLQLECDRLHYILVSYHRCRLYKIEKFAIFIYLNESQRERLARAESNFLTKYLDLIGHHTNYNIFSALPLPLHSMKEKDMIHSPNMGEMVGFRCKLSMGTAELEGQEFEFREGNVVVAPYEKVKTFLFEDQIKLI